MTFILNESGFYIWLQRHWDSSCPDKTTAQLPLWCQKRIFTSRLEVITYFLLCSLPVLHFSSCDSSRLRKEKELLSWFCWHLPGRGRISLAACTATRARSSWSLCPSRSTHPSRPWASSCPSARSVPTPRYAAPTPRTRSLSERVRRASCIPVFAAFDFQKTAANLFLCSPSSRE